MNGRMKHSSNKVWTKWYELKIIECNTQRISFLDVADDKSTKVVTMELQPDGSYLYSDPDDDWCDYKGLLSGMIMSGTWEFSDSSCTGGFEIALG